MGEITSSSDGSVTNSSSSSSPPHQGLLERLKHYGQEHVFSLWDELSIQDKDLLVRDIQNLDLPRIDQIIRCSLRSQGLPVPTIEPVPETSVSSVDVRTLEERERWWKMGLKAISEGKLAVLLLAGGQGTRLGSPDPKGSQSVNEGSGGFVAIHWYIMTSPMTDDQGTIPCVSKDGRFIMESPSKVAKSPDGNGGVYSALKTLRLLEDMAMRGVKYVDCYGVDNALVRVADPTFLGYFIDKGVVSAAKVVHKAYPQEKVGVFVQRSKGGPLAVVEYSEMDQSMTSAIDQETGRLRYCSSNVCLHMFTLDFLNQVANGLEKDSIYHFAEKKVASIHGDIMGLKLEQFIFDAFTYAPFITHNGNSCTNFWDGKNRCLYPLDIAAS
ncbi:hypothetical protein MKX03_018213 [Papaver bracteatum]|nr:hypothetical protein MKX03_018213 [Papaver bracteatum]